jgi:hypothetical protein
MPCEYCRVPNLHTLASCREIIPSVEKFRQTLEVGFTSLHYDQFKRELRDVRTPILKRLVKTFHGKMNQTRQSLEQVVLQNLCNNVHRYIKAEFIKGGGQCGLRYFTNAFSCFIRYAEMYQSRLSPDEFWGVCQGMIKRTQLLETAIQAPNVQEFYTLMRIANDYTTLVSTLNDVREFVSKHKEKHDEYIQRKSRLVLYRLNFNTDLFRHIMAFL